MKRKDFEKKYPLLNKQKASEIFRGFYIPLNPLIS